MSRLDTDCSLSSFKATAEQGKKKLKLHLQISVSPEAARGVDLESLVGVFKTVGKSKKDERKLTVTVQQARL